VPFEFAYPLYQWLPLALIGVAIVALLLRRADQRRQRRLDRFVQTTLIPRLLVGYDAAIRRPLFWLTIAGFACIALTLAQPHWGQAWREVSKQSRDILIVLDTSESMRATNPLPNRLERAKYKITTLMEAAPADRFGLIAFSGGAALQCPPTADHAYFRAVLDAVDTDSISLEGTDIAAALMKCLEAFRDESGAPSLHQRENRAVLLISDGEQVSGDAQEAAKKLAEYARIYVMGVGDPRGVEVAMPEWITRTSEAGHVDRTHLSRLDEDALIQIAATGNGLYVRSIAEDWDADQIIEKMKVVATRSVGSDVRLRLVNRFRWPLAAAILLFSAEGLWWVIMPLVRRWRTGRSRSTQSETTQHA
jgi:Ca-activated chloride channel family protein